MAGAVRISKFNISLQVRYQDGRLPLAVGYTRWLAAAFDGSLDASNIGGAGNVDTVDSVGQDEGLDAVDGDCELIGRVVAVPIV